MKNYIIIVSIFLLNGCTYKISDINVAGKDKPCVKECTKYYSNCVSAGNQIGFKTETLRACKDSFEICVNTCN